MKVKHRNKPRRNSRNVEWKYFWVLLRVCVGFVFLWAFLDKTFGLGLSTASANAWINGGSPTAGFLLHGTSGPLASVFHSMASSVIVEWLFMLGLLFVGLTMILGMAMRIGTIAGVAMVFLMWIAVLPIENNPFLDDHWFLAFALIASTITNSGDFIGFGKRWKGLKFVKRNPIFE